MAEEYSNSPRPGIHPGSSQSPGSAATRCVVLVCPDGATPVDLLGGLSRRGVSSHVVTDSAAVMVELARHHTGALVVVDPTRQPGLVDLIEAVITYHPRTVRWAYYAAHAANKAQLQPLNVRSGGEDANHHSANPPHPIEPAQVPDASSSSPLGRVQDQVPPDRVRSLIVKVQGPAEVGEPLISEEELAMLLGPVPEEQGGEL